MANTDASRSWQQVNPQASWRANLQLCWWCTEHTSELGLTLRRVHGSWAT